MSFQILIQETEAHDVPFAVFLNSDNTLFIYSLKVLSTTMALK